MMVQVACLIIYYTYFIISYFLLFYYSYFTVYFVILHFDNKLNTSIKITTNIHVYMCCADIFIH